MNKLHTLKLQSSRLGKGFCDLALAPLWLTWMMVAAIKRMIRWFPEPDALPNGDAFWTYLPNARHFAANPWTFLTQVEDSIYVAPLGYIWPALWGADPARIQLANCCLFLLSILLMWRLATRLGGPLAGMVSTALLVFYPDLISYIPQVLTEPPYLFSMLLFFTATVEYTLAASHRRTWLAIMALGLTMTLLLRPVLQIFALLTLIFVVLGICFSRRSPAGALKGWGLLINRSVALALIAALLIPASTLVKNGLGFQFWGLSTGAGSGLYYGTSPFKMGIEPVYGGYGYDAGIIPGVSVPSTNGHPLKPLADAALSRAAVSVIQNTSLEDNLHFYVFKLKAWLFYGEEELRIQPVMRTVRSFEWLAIMLAFFTVVIQGFVRSDRDSRLWRIRPDLMPDADGLGKRRMALCALLLMLTLAMSVQLSPVLYNVRYNTFFMEPMLMPLCGVSIALLLRPLWPPRKTYAAQTRTRRLIQWLTWLTPRLLIVAVLAYVPGALTKHAIRHRAWAMDPLRPGPTELVLSPSQMQAPEATNATASATDQWTSTQRPAILTIPFELNQPTDAGAFMDGIWRLKLSVKSPHYDRNCSNVLMELTTPSPEPLWYAPESLIHVQADGSMRLYAIRGNGVLRPSASGAIKLTFNCPAGTEIGWGRAQLLRVTTPEATRALINENKPINPYRADDIQ